VAQFDSIRFQPSRPLLKEVSADRLNAILSEIKKNRPRGERGITVRQAGDATYIGLAAKLGGSGSAVESSPWDIYVENSPEEGQYTLKVEPGTLSGILPTNWEDEFSVDSGSLYYGIARVTTDGQFVNGVTIEITEDSPAPQQPQKYAIAQEVEILFGLFKDGQSFNVTGGRDISVTARNVITTTADPSPGPGQPLFDLYYRLQQ
jgi:hypothetical protein